MHGQQNVKRFLSYNNFDTENFVTKSVFGKQPLTASRAVKLTLGICGEKTDFHHKTKKGSVLQIVTQGAGRLD